MTGRPKGTAKTGGRELGTPNKPTFDLQGVASPDGQLTPLSFALAILKDKNMPDKDRKWAARVAMPYVHPRPRPALAAAAKVGKVIVEICRFTDEKPHDMTLAELDALGDPQGRAARMQAAESAMPFVHAPVQPAATNTGGVNVQVRHVTHDQLQPVEQVHAMDRIEAQWFNMDSPSPAHAPALPPQMSAPAPMPAPTPTPPPPLAPLQPPAPAVMVDHVSCGTEHPGNGNGAGQIQRVNGHPRRVNGAVVRRSDDEIRNISDRRRALSDYPATHPIHGIV